MKHLKKLLLIILIVPCLFIFNACSFSPKPYVTDIVEGKTIGDQTNYTIYYSDGSKSTISIKNGKDGKDGEDLTIESIYEKYKAENPDKTYEEFLEEYLTVIQNEYSTVIENSDSTSAVTNATNLAIQSTVTIWCEFPVTGSLGKDVSVACGSGFIYKMDTTYSYIVTNYHVVYMLNCNTSNDIAQDIRIFQYGTTEYAYKVVEYDLLGNSYPVYDDNGYPEIGYGEGAIEAKYVGGELTYDIAIIKVKTSDLLKQNPFAKAVTIADDYELAETAIAIGNPEGAGTSVTSGIVSVVNEEITMEGADNETMCKFRVMRIDTAVNGGNSGGGLFDIDGKLIGIVNAKAVASEIDNIAYAIPFDNVVAVANNILDNYDGSSDSIVKKLYLGFSYSVENHKATYNPTTNKTTLSNEIKIGEVTKNTLAEQMGLAKNDIIRSVVINGTEHQITQSYEFADLLLTIRAGDSFVIKVQRGNSTDLTECKLPNNEKISDSNLKTIAEITELTK